MKSFPVLVAVYAYALVVVPDGPAQPHPVAPDGPAQPHPVAPDGPAQPHPVALRRERLNRQAQHARRGRR